MIYEKEKTGMLTCSLSLSAVKSRLGKSLETKTIYIYMIKSELSEHVLFEEYLCL
ncbi:hypothetical protein HanXRQr2_Chr09g0416531 [Helianthus annuus]|uniref:Uncharacterized protein n=1 Tax=Helianthus annuus TaxID=4232 RepID=A0A251U0F4_HELAN|nr:hypothetical protein HanXRQr2_Chr09g0416531 [Helianthus annuus]